ncbi:hypothetical protein FRC17_009167 [Serendipita sp. 399]|nr:hypothetical protein FRC17_009167 [Serendipita sp. 399]
MAPLSQERPAQKLDTEKQSLVIAITALLLSSILAALQLLLSYVTSATSRQKTDSAAIGTWSKHTKWGFRRFWKGKVHITYGVVDLSTDAIWETLRQLERKKVLLSSKLGEYRVSEAVPLVLTKDGTKRRGDGICIRDPHTDVEVPLEKLTNEERDAVSQLEALLKPKAAFRPRSSAFSLVADLGVDAAALRTQRSEDADTIPPNCNTPLYPIRASDLISIGLLIGMKLDTVDISKRLLSMHGPHSYIFTEQIQNVGPVCRYVALAPGMMSEMIGWNYLESRTCIEMASGSISVGESCIPSQILGYNAINRIFKFVIGEDNDTQPLANTEEEEKDDSDDESNAIPQQLKSQLLSWLIAAAGDTPDDARAVSNLLSRVQEVTGTEGLSTTGIPQEMESNAQVSMKQDLGWKEIRIAPIRNQIVADNNSIWGGRWANPLTTTTALFLATCSNPAVAKAFPHTILEDWTTYNSSSAEHALNLFRQDNTIATPPPKFLLSLIKKHLVKSDAYKAVDNFGCEYGGMRSYLATNLAELVHRFTEFWYLDPVSEDSPSDPPSDQPPFPRVPILNEILAALVSGTSLSEWASTWDHAPLEGKHVRLYARSALWIQISLFDTWIGPMIDRMMGGAPIRESPIPATKEEAEQCLKASRALRPTTAWNLIRSRWMTYYLKRLAEGRDDMGDSFMSKNPREELGERWVGMEVGEPLEWLRIDAVITLRAAVMHAMLTHLDDTSILLQLKETDPLIFLS